MTRQEAHNRLRRVRDELLAARYALGRAEAKWDAEAGTAAAEFRGDVTLDEIRRAAGNLERTFVLRLFSEFEGILVDFGENTLDLPGEDSKAAQLIDQIGAARNIGASHRQGAHEVRKWRNKLVHPRAKADFVRHYETPKPRKDVTFESYRIEDCLQGLKVTRGYEKALVVDHTAAIPHFQQQLKIVQAAKGRFESSLFDIRQLVQADLFDSELDAARELAKKGFLRAAGAVAGVVLEKHLVQVASNHSISGKKAHPSIRDLNDALKGNGVYEVPEWRRVQRLGDIRNMCDHGKTREPTADEIQELIDGTDKFVKAIF